MAMARYWKMSQTRNLLTMQKTTNTTTSWSVGWSIRRMYLPETKKNQFRLCFSFPHYQTNIRNVESVRSIKLELARILSDAVNNLPIAYYSIEFMPTVDRKIFENLFYMSPSPLRLQSDTAALIKHHIKVIALVIC